MEDRCASDEYNQEFKQTGDPCIALMLMNDQNRGRAYQRDKKHMDKKRDHRRVSNPYGPR
jgi:hypothetical protein